MKIFGVYFIYYILHYLVIIKEKLNCLDKCLLDKHVNL